MNTCETCKHWTANSNGKDGTCPVISDYIWPMMDEDTPETDKDFGCLLWEGEECKTAPGFIDKIVWPVDSDTAKMLWDIPVTSEEEYQRLLNEGKIKIVTHPPQKPPQK